MGIGDRSTNEIWTQENLTVILPAVTKHLTELAEVPVGANILDIASGSGTCAVAFATLHAKSTVVATDVKDEQIDACMKHITAKGLKNAQVQREDAANLSFADEAFDLVTGTGALSNFDDPAKSLAEAYRVLKPNGQLAVGDFLVQEGAQEVYGILSALKYGSRRPLLHYGKVMDLLYDAGFEVTSYRPLRWIMPIEKKFASGWDEKLKKAYLQAHLDMNPETKMAMRLIQRNGRWVIIYDCFALVAKKYNGCPEWEYEDK